MLGEWVNEMEHPRDSNDGVIMLKVSILFCSMKISTLVKYNTFSPFFTTQRFIKKMISMRPACKVSVDGKIMSDESVAKLHLLPLRCYIDQIALRFIKDFFSSNDSDDSSEMEGDEMNTDDENDIEIIATFFKAFNITHTKLKVNYNPVGVNMMALKDESYTELLNLFPLEGTELFLQPVHIQNLIGWGAVLGEMSSR